MQMIPYLIFSVLFLYWAHVKVRHALMSKREKLKLEILRESKRMRRVVKTLDRLNAEVIRKETERKRRRDRCIELVHQYRRTGNGKEH